MSDDPRSDFKRIVGMTRGGAESPLTQPTTVTVNVNMDDLVDYANIHTYEDCETHVITLMQSRDKNSFAVGDTLRAFEVNRGHPLDEDQTLTRMASRAGCLPSQLSMWRAVSMFYSTENRTFETLRWSHYYQAMMFSGGVLDNALELLTYAHDNDLTVSQFRNWLKKQVKGTPPPPSTPNDDAEDQPEGEPDIALDGDASKVLWDLTAMIDRAGRLVLKGWWR